ncbi:hypothetical protein OF829_17865 [Sphingomonas sp. LB-2]|uniref:hypothetical protein n=1 Tax=Sphingomonas caeni TaxID=2984949 RepID=UPI0022309C4C|nr:hypothetical protein [Sphingomonas caeni]MCW3849110.1 hypothetical protein [Sphingomonas caeni]
MRDAAPKADGGAPYKLGHLVDDAWRPYSHPPVFDIHRTANGQSRLMATAPGSDPLVFLKLAECLTPPFILLYILHTPRSETEPGRYQSEEISGAELRAFVETFATFLSSDARFDLWVYSPEDRATIVWDRHDLVYGYGPVEALENGLRGLGFSRGEPQLPVPHEHHYHPGCDEAARSLLASRDWSWSPLMPEDEQ